MLLLRLNPDWGWRCLCFCCHQINTPLQTAGKNSLNTGVDGSVGPMAVDGMVLDTVISKVGLRWLPTCVELVLVDSVAEPVEPRVNCFGSLLSHGVVDDALSGVVVCLD